MLQAAFLAFLRDQQKLSITGLLVKLDCPFLFVIKGLSDGKFALFLIDLSCIASHKTNPRKLLHCRLILARKRPQSKYIAAELASELDLKIINRKSKPLSYL